MKVISLPDLAHPLFFLNLSPAKNSRNKFFFFPSEEEINLLISDRLEAVKDKVELFYTRDQWGTFIPRAFTDENGDNPRLLALYSGEELIRAQNIVNSFRDEKQRLNWYPRIDRALTRTTFIAFVAAVVFALFVVTGCLASGWFIAAPFLLGLLLLAIDEHAVKHQVKTAEEALEILCAREQRCLQNILEDFQSMQNQLAPLLAQSSAIEDLFAHLEQEVSVPSIPVDEDAIQNKLLDEDFQIELNKYFEKPYRISKNYQPRSMHKLVPELEKKNRSLFEEVEVLKKQLVVLNKRALIGARLDRWEAVQAIRDGVREIMAQEKLCSVSRDERLSRIKCHLVQLSGEVNAKVDEVLSTTGTFKFQALDETQEFERFASQPTTVSKLSQG